MDDRVNTWTPGRVIDAIEGGQTLPADWKIILRDSGYDVPWLKETP